MRFYYCYNPASTDAGDPTGSQYVATIADARRWARALPRGLRFDAEVTLVDVPTDRENLLRVLNGVGGYEVRRCRWVVTDRGGLRAEG